MPRREVCPHATRPGRQRVDMASVGDSEGRGEVAGDGRAVHIDARGHLKGAIAEPTPVTHVSDVSDTDSSADRMRTYRPTKGLAGHPLICAVL